MTETRAIERVQVRLSDGVERTLRYTLRAMKEAREEFGGSITSMETLRKLDETNLGKLLWYGLRADQPELTVEQIEELIEPTMFRDLMDCYTRAVSASLPESKNEQSPAALLAEAQRLMDRAEALTKTMNQTGSDSGHSGGTILDFPSVNSGTSLSENSEHLEIAIASV